MSGSAIYVGTIRHRRMGAPAHDFSYRVWYLLLDLDEVPYLARRTRFFSHNRLNLASFDDRDHMGPKPEAVRAKLEAWLESRAVNIPPARISVLTQPRILGHAFNPVSFFFCRDEQDRLRYVVAEVNNTFGETYCYLLKADGTTVRREEDKVFHVSPFQPVSGRYRFRITDPGDRFSAHIDVLRNGDRFFDSTLAVTRRPLDSRTVLTTVLRHPHTGLRTLTLIHYQALRLWLKRAPFFSKPEPPAEAWRTRHG